MTTNHKPTAARSILNLLNKATSFADLVLLSKQEYFFLFNSAMVEKLTSESKFIALSGAISAFANYMTLRGNENISFANLAEYLQHPHQLADRITELASFQSNEIDEFMKYYAEHFQESNSQWTQDIFVSYSLRRKTGGRFLEVGGADGITHSNTLNLEKLFGWSGTLAEPHPLQFEFLKKTRNNPRNTLLNCAVMPRNGNGIVILKDSWQLSAIEEHSGNDLHQASRDSSTVTHKVASRSFEDVLIACGPLDYLSLDVEGPEFELLASINWKKVSLPPIITVEHNWRTETANKIRNLLSLYGYKEPFKDYPWLTRGDLWMKR
jgi:FkbM family methyltransferase